jgi:hypothetical protein
MIINTAMIGEMAISMHTAFGSAQFVAIYQGAQPTQSAFNAAWSTNYFIQESDSTVGSDVLAIYGSSNQISNSSTGLYLSSAGTSTYHANGTAAWAAIIYVPASLESSTNPASLRYIICDVSNAAGTGAVKVDSTTVSGSAPVLTDINIVIGAA